MDPELHRSGGITRKPWTTFALIALVITLLMTLLYRTTQRSIINEIRNHAMGVAIATAAGIDPTDLATIRSVEDMSSAAYKRVQTFLGRISDSNPDVRYIYTMRRVDAGHAAVTDYEYIVDEAEQDDNSNGVIDPDEQSELPATPYDATEWPELVKAWQRATADHIIRPDPPYPDLLSGYAPIRNSLGQTVGIVGVDVTADTVNDKLFAVRSVMLVATVLLMVLSLLVIQLYYMQKYAYEQVKELNDKLAMNRRLDDDLL